MKYNESNKPIVCMQTNSTCYKGTTTMKVLGVLWHSTGCNNPNVKRYVQPFETDSNYAEMIKLLGKNEYNNDWNHIEREAGLNAWIGKLADGSIATVQTMPWNYRPWGCGSGDKGSCNSGWIQFEICEDSLTDKNYFDSVYNEAVELTAYLCNLYNIDPNGNVVHNGVSVPTILCHADSYKLGLGSNHGDVLHWFKKYNKTMDNVRTDVNNKLIEIKKTSVNMTEKEIWDYLLAQGMTEAGVAGLMGNLRAESNLRANNLENVGSKELGLSDEQYTEMVDKGTYTKEQFIRDSHGYGLAQWTWWSRKQALYEYCLSKGASIGCCKTQLDFMIQELNKYKSVISILKSTNSVREASNAVLLEYERPANMGESVQNTRASYSQAYYDKHVKKQQTVVDNTQNLYRVRKSWSDDKSQLGAYKEIDNAKRKADENKGYHVFDWNGNIVYSPKSETKVETPKTETVVEKPKTITEGDIITLKAGATYWNGKKIPDWVFKSTLYYRGKNNNGVIFSTLKTGAITGVVKEESIVELNKTVAVTEFKPYTVKVSINNLNIRKGAGTNYGVARVCPVGIYTIVEESNGQGASKWGKLKSGAGWISLDHVTKL